MNGSALRLSEAERSRLQLGAAALGVVLDAGAVARLSGFADLLGVWGERTNLIACRDGLELVERHFLDSLAVESLLPDACTVVDLGSGAGFPGIPLAIVSPHRTVVVVEARRRRANFLREVRRSLGLENLEVLEQRAEAPGHHAHSAGVVVVRAVWSDASDVNLAAEWLGPGGCLFWMRSSPGKGEDLAKLTWDRRESYRIGTDRPRVIEVFRAR